MSNDDEIRFTAKMTRQLREDAKRNTERGELSREIRDLFRQIAYGANATTEQSELEQKKAELREVRNQIDDRRTERSRLDTEIETLETRATRLEERISSLEETHDELDTKIEMLENMLHNGDRMWPTRIKNAAGVDAGTANQLYQKLRERNAELPESAFKEPKIHAPNDWTEVDR